MSTSRKNKNAGGTARQDHGQHTRGSGRISTYSRENKAATADSYGVALDRRDDKIAGHVVQYAGQ